MKKPFSTALSGELPIQTVLAGVVAALQEVGSCLLVAQPGAGKTTRAPLALLQAFSADEGRWLLLEPRRVAARLAAGYMAEQLQEPLGATIGYRVRGEQKVSATTRLEVVTQGVLTRLLQDDPMLEGVAGIIFDEFHERSLEADLGLALVRDVQQGLREDLKLLVMSATLDVGLLLQTLGDTTPVIDCPGSSWPVSTFYRPVPTREKLEQHAAKVIQDALQQHAGDVLVFLPGQAEIFRLQRVLLDRLPADVDLAVLHGQLPLVQQQAVLRPSVTNRRRVVLSTALAESSLTLPGIRIVVDCGLERVPVFQPASGLTRLDTRRVNRASADQRRGRAGREAEGFCYRLWSAELLLVAHAEPEIQQSDLSGLAAELARWGVKNADQLSWVTPPPPKVLAAGQQLLQQLGVMDNERGLTPLGQQLGRWPTHPRLAVLLNAAKKRNALPLACWLVALLEEHLPTQDIDLLHLLEQRPRQAGEGAAGRWFRAAQQWARRVNCKLEPVDFALLPQLLLAAYPDRLAQSRGEGRFKLVTGGQAWLPAEHTLAKSEWLVAVELDGQVSGARVFQAVAVPSERVAANYPQASEWQVRVDWDDEAGRVVGEEVKAIGELVFMRRPLQKLPEGKAASVLLQVLQQKGVLPWSAMDQQLLGRLRLLNRVLGDPWPDASDQHLLQTAEIWLLPHLEGITRMEQLEKAPLGEWLLQSLDWQQQQTLAKLAPTHLKVPSGSRVLLDYSGDEPVLAVKLQELFGQTETPRLVDGRVPVLLHLLSPARRPVQVTRDLAGFWAKTYFEVRKDLKGRYPRHPWPDDPLQAIPTAKTQRHAQKLADSG